MDKKEMRDEKLRANVQSKWGKKVWLKEASRRLGKDQLAPFCQNVAFLVSQIQELEIGLGV